MAAAFSNGTRKFFNMSTAPTGWTRDATAYDHAILIAGVGNYTSSTGGVSNFTTVHPSTTMSASASGTFFGSTTSDSALDIPSHTHTGTSNARTSSVFGTTQTGYTVPSSGPRTVPYWRFATAHTAQSFSENDWSDAWPTGSIGMGSLVVGTTYSIAALGTTTAAQWSTVSGGSLSASSKNTAVGDTFVAATTGSGLGTGQVRAQIPGGTHNHNTSVTGTFTNSGTKSFNLGVKYVDLMLASKNGIYGATWASQTSSTVVKGNFVSFTWNTPTTTIPVGSTIYYTIQNIGYTGALSSTARSGSFVTTGATFTQSITITDNSVWDNGGSFMIQIRSDSIDGTIMARSQVVTITEPNPTILFGVLPTPITEGTSGTFTFTTTRLKNGEILTYTVNNTTTSNADFSSLTGSVIVASNAGTFTITPTIDLLVESAETFTVSLKTSSGLTFTSGSISITNVTPTVTFTVTPTTLSVNTAGTFTITTTNVPNGTPLTWEIGGGNDFQGTYANSTGTVYIYNNTGTFYITPNSVRDIFKAFQVSTWNFTVRIKNSTGQTLQTSALVTVNNCTVAFVTPTTTFDQGQTVRYNITTTNIPNGTRLLWKIAHGIGNDTCFSAVQGYVTIDNNTGSFTISATSNNTFAGSAWTTHTMDIYDFAGTFKLTGSGVGVTPVTYGVGVIYVYQTYPGLSCKFITPPLSISEGTAATLEFISNISSGTLYWTINNTTSSNADFTGSVVSGSITVVIDKVIDSTNLNQRYLQRFTLPSTAVDTLNESTETFTVSIRTGSITGTVIGTSEIISIVNVPVTYYFADFSTVINEGTSNTYRINTTSVVNGTILYWDIVNTTTSLIDFSGSTSGSFTINSNTGTFTITAALDTVTDGNEKFTINVRTGSNTGTIQTSLPITLVQIVLNPTYTFSSPTLTLSEESVATYTINTSDVNIGTTLYYTLNHITTSNADFRIPSSSVYFDGSSYLTPPVNTAFAFGTGDFTIEAWFYSTNIAIAGAIFDNRIPDARDQGFGFFISSSRINFGTASVNYRVGVTTLLSNTWYHVALSRSTVSGVTSTKMFLNGVQEGATVTLASQNFTNSTTRIGYGQNGYFNGYISNLRVVKGTGLYTTTFTPTGPLINTAQTILLLCQGPTVTSDNSTANNGSSWSITTVGSPTISTSITPLLPFNGIGSFVIDSGPISAGTGSFTIATKTDSSFELDETFSILIRTDSISGTIVATSPTITIATNAS